METLVISIPSCSAFQIQKNIVKNTTILRSYQICVYQWKEFWKHLIQGKAKSYPLTIFIDKLEVLQKDSKLESSRIPKIFTSVFLIIWLNSKEKGGIKVLRKVSLRGRYVLLFYVLVVWRWVKLLKNSLIFVLISKRKVITKQINSKNGGIITEKRS